MLTAAPDVPYLRDNYAPVAEEHDHLALTCTFGQVPRDLAGVFVRNGANMARPPRARHHWFDGCENTCKKSPLAAECLNAAPLSDAFRNVTNLNGVVGYDNPFPTQWYRFTGAAGIKMPTTAPPTSACGTHATGWLSGKEPTVNEGAVARTICFHWNGNTCNWSEPAQVRNCGDYFGDYLKNVSWGCSGRYCGTN